MDAQDHLRASYASGSSYSGWRSSSPSSQPRDSLASCITTYSESACQTPPLSRCSSVASLPITRYGSLSTERCLTTGAPPTTLRQQDGPSLPAPIAPLPLNPAHPLSRVRQEASPGLSTDSPACVCEHCGATFTRSASLTLREHLKACPSLGKGELAYECSACFRLFPNHAQAAQHRKATHKGVPAIVELRLPGRRAFTSCFRDKIFYSIDEWVKWSIGKECRAKRRSMQSDHRLRLKTLLQEGRDDVSGHTGVHRAVIEWCTAHDLELDAWQSIVRVPVTGWTQHGRPTSAQALADKLDWGLVVTTEEEQWQALQQYGMPSIISTPDTARALKTLGFQILQEMLDTILTPLIKLYTPKATDFVSLIACAQNSTEYYGAPIDALLPQYPALFAGGAGRPSAQVSEADVLPFAGPSAEHRGEWRRTASVAPFHQGAILASTLQPYNASTFERTVESNNATAAHVFNGWYTSQEHQLYHPTQDAAFQSTVYEHVDPNRAVSQPVHIVTTQYEPDVAMTQRKTKRPPSLASKDHPDSFARAIPDHGRSTTPPEMARLHLSQHQAITQGDEESARPLAHPHQGFAISSTSQLRNRSAFLGVSNAYHFEELPAVTKPEAPGNEPAMTSAVETKTAHVYPPDASAAPPQRPTALFGEILMPGASSSLPIKPNATQQTCNNISDRACCAASSSQGGDVVQAELRLSSEMQPEPQVPSLTFAEWSEIVDRLLPPGVDKNDIPRMQRTRRELIAAGVVSTNLELMRITSILTTFAYNIEHWRQQQRLREQLTPQVPVAESHEVVEERRQKQKRQGRFFDPSAAESVQQALNGQAQDAAVIIEPPLSELTS
ncbi:hypothetical protein BAUCODRAFT_37485 [Baudoinia panamericana UAMH 10762]|uniref:C2H2-type domain-containing protein n=1 Tax=Baudoinia panamericana (strain UAMH 10762) TaxID=717646 RepID=M2N1S2_BAUPA|nr:uncharacterized protein BAUCODRAFT_37485 [Baudoinia panamericana UAMH 10762]EMC92595.1 hypothetical protein BAUCODRAFT_37485 [Baudoinia panamericana UAMH 10762]